MCFDRHRSASAGAPPPPPPPQLARRGENFRPRFSRCRARRRRGRFRRAHRDTRDVVRSSAHPATLRSELSVSAESRRRRGSQDGLAARSSSRAGPPGSRRCGSGLGGALWSRHGSCRSPAPRRRWRGCGRPPPRRSKAEFVSMSARGGGALILLRVKSSRRPPARCASSATSRRLSSGRDPVVAHVARSPRCPSPQAHWAKVLQQGSSVPIPVSCGDICVGEGCASGSATPRPSPQTAWEGDCKHDRAGTVSTRRSLPLSARNEREGAGRGARGRSAMPSPIRSVPSQTPPGFFG